MDSFNQSAPVVIIGAGPAGLMAAEVLAQNGVRAVVLDAMASSGRKFLLAGRGGLNLTHAEAKPAFLARYRPQAPMLLEAVFAFDADAVCAFAHGLGIDTFVGSSLRVFPKEMKAAPMLRAWLHRLRGQGVQFKMRQRLTRWDACELPGAPGWTLHLQDGDGQMHLQPARAVVLALGGGSWARLGSDGAWVPMLRACGVTVHDLQASNCGFDAMLSSFFRERFAGQPMQSVALGWQGDDGQLHWRQGQFVFTATGVEGSLIYALSAILREQINQHGKTTIWADLLPDWSPEKIAQALTAPRGSRSFSSYLQSCLGLKGVQLALLREGFPGVDGQALSDLPPKLKAVPLVLHRTRPLDEAISSAGGVAWESLDENWMLRALPGMFCAGEMLDWEAPTGGYLLTACLASGRAAAQGLLRWLTLPKMV